MQRLAYKDPSGGIHLLTGSLPPLAQGYEWTRVIDAEPATGAEAEELAEADQSPEVSATGAQLPAPRPATRRPRRRQPSQQPGIVDELIPVLTPRPGQTPQERARELIDAMPADTRGKVKELLQAFQGQRQDLPPFPRG